MLAPLEVREVMVEDVATIGPDATVAEAADRMADRDIGSLVVCEDDRPVGILTTSDVVAVIAAPEGPQDVTVGDRMSAPLVTIGPDATVEEAAARLRDEGIKRLPVVESAEPRSADQSSGPDTRDDVAVVGIVTVTDLSYYVPQLAIGRRPSESRRAGPPEVAYEEADWEVEVEAGDEQPEVGDVVRFTKTLDDEDVRSFAAASGDTNRLHLDDEFAAGTRFGGRIVHGTLVGGLVSAALARLPGLTIYLSQELSFREAVAIGATVTAVCEVTEALGGSRYRVSTTVYHDDEAVLDGDAAVLVDPLHEAAPLERSEVERSGTDDAVGQ